MRARVSQQLPPGPAGPRLGRKEAPSPSMAGQLLPPPASAPGPCWLPRQPLCQAAGGLLCPHLAPWHQGPPAFSPTWHPSAVSPCAGTPRSPPGARPLSLWEKEECGGFAEQAQSHEGTTPWSALREPCSCPPSPPVVALRNGTLVSPVDVPPLPLGRERQVSLQHRPRAPRCGAPLVPGQPRPCPAFSSRCQVALTHGLSPAFPFVALVARVTMATLTSATCTQKRDSDGLSPTPPI